MFTRFNTRRPNHLLHKHCEIRLVHTLGRVAVHEYSNSAHMIGLLRARGERHATTAPPTMLRLNAHPQASE
jgi:hypothetical protein